VCVIRHRAKGNVGEARSTIIANQNGVLLLLREVGLSKRWVDRQMPQRAVLAGSDRSPLKDEETNGGEAPAAVNITTDTTWGTGGFHHHHVTLQGRRGVIAAPFSRALSSPFAQSPSDAPGGMRRREGVARRRKSSRGKVRGVGRDHAKEVGKKIGGTHTNGQTDISNGPEKKRGTTAKKKTAALLPLSISIDCESTGGIRPW